MGGPAEPARSFTRSEDETLPAPTPLPGWHSKSYPDAGEAVAYYVGSASEGGSEFWSSLTDEERAAENNLRAVRRAKGEMRRYIVSNGLRYMWVLTLAGEGLHGADGRAAIMRRVARLAVALRQQVGQALPYLYSPELHPGGHGWHVNFFVGRRIDHAVMARLWKAAEADGPAPCGYVFVSDWARDRRAKSVRDGIRQGARYGAKYAAKDWATELLEGGQHRYEVAQGFQPSIVRRWARKQRDAIWQVCEVFGEKPPDEVWISDTEASWHGPPVVCMWWT